MISFELVNAINPATSMADGPKYVEHAMISPNGKKFAFLHRWKSQGGIQTRLYVANMDGSGLRILNDSSRMSHFCWRNDSQLIGWGGLSNPINRGKFVH